MVTDDQDEWDERIKQSLRYGIRILIKHPTIDPSKITQVLGIRPNSTTMVGEPRKTPKGASLPGVYRESTWSHWFNVQRNRLFFQDVTKLVETLEPHKQFLHELADQGGTVDLIVNLPGDINIGDDFGWRDMARLVALRIDLGIEVFPDFN